MRNILLIALVGFLALALGLAACDDDDNSGDAIAPTATSDAVLGITDTTVGDGAEAQAGDLITVHYTGRLEDGTVFDSSVERGEPIEFTLGVGRVIPGWDQGLAGMQVGGKRELVIPPEFGYGSQGSQDGSIPPDATITFEVELLDVVPPPTPTPAP